jgi:putative spermidine/putrescine transport system permease protein/spermidine/putrescine transport system permease protein
MYIIVFLGYPLIDIFKESIYDEHLTLQYYIRFFTGGPYLKVLILTLKVSTIVTLICLVAGYIVAYTLTFISDKFRNILFIGILIPFWTSLLVRTYALIVLLQTQGVINKFLLSIGIITAPLKLIYNTTGVVIGMTYALLPYMILSIYVVMQGIDKNLLKAGESLGASPFTVFKKIFLPLSFPGVIAGSILVFMMSIGYFITPSLLGGQNDIMISQLIQMQVEESLNWNFASAISFTLLAVSLMLMLLFKKFTKVNTFYKGVI